MQNARQPIRRQHKSDILHPLRAARRFWGLENVQYVSAFQRSAESARPGRRRIADRRHGPGAMEGPDDMPSHIRMALTRTSESIPVAAGQLWLGTWQGLFLYEHRALGTERSVVVSVIGTTK
jgi:hypothetical protein